MIRKQTVYTETVGEGEEMEIRMVTADEAIDIEDSSMFAGHALIGIQTPQGTIEQPIRFGIFGAVDIRDAFAKFEEARATEAPKEAKKIVDAIKEQFEAEQKKILVPGRR